MGSLCQLALFDRGEAHSRCARSISGDSDAVIRAENGRRCLTDRYMYGRKIAEHDHSTPDSLRAPNYHAPHRHPPMALAARCTAGLVH